MNIKTFNKHCVAVYNPHGVTVFSYDTPVCCIHDCEIIRLWNGWSATTQRDINTVLNIGMTKKEWLKMPVQN